MDKDKENFLGSSAMPDYPPVGREGLKHNQEEVMPISSTSESAVRNADRAESLSWEATER